MPNVFDYMAWRGDLDFKNAPFNEVDNLILAELCYLDFAGIVPIATEEGMTLKEVARRYFIIHPYRKGALGVLVPDGIQDLLSEAANCPRFQNIRLSTHVNNIDERAEKQFSATTFTLNEELRYVAFRGTDDTIVGWKENFNMAYQFPVPAQMEAANYLNFIAASSAQYKLLVGGHSKGGNLAIYASAFCQPAVQERIAGVYNNDGPGFHIAILEKENYQRIRNRVRTLLPQSSTVGILLEHESSYQVITSSASGIAQHDGLTWQVKGTRFIYADKLHSGSERKDKTLHAWVNDMDMEQRKLFVQKLFALRNNTSASTLSQLLKQPKQTLAAIQAAFDDPATAEVLKYCFGILLKKEKEIRTQGVTENLTKALPGKKSKR